MTRAFQLNLTVLSMVSLLVGLFLVYNTVSFAVVRRRREIGILSAMGLSRQAVVALFIIEAAVLGLVGGLLGSPRAACYWREASCPASIARIRSLCVGRRDGGTAIRFPIHPRSTDFPLARRSGVGNRHLDHRSARS